MTIAITIFVSLIASVVAAELLGWMARLCEFLVRQAARRMPKQHRGRWRDEWLAELDSIRNHGPLSKLKWALSVYLRSGATARVVVDAPFRPAAHDLFWGAPPEEIDQLAHEEAVRQLAAGNRETEESYEDRAYRSKLAQWIAVPDELIGKHGDFELLPGASFKIAPLTFDALVKIWKRALLSSDK
ncbi:MAG: hypothetical protein QOI58_3612 [Thermoanaerobaculia bacterium]|jgi:hypothetical protein|nr:hypothetical protein [Thermoanaerobaculia bacterium]